MEWGAESPGLLCLLHYHLGRVLFSYQGNTVAWQHQQQRRAQQQGVWQAHDCALLKQAATIGREVLWSSGLGCGLATACRAAVMVGSAVDEYLC